MINDYYNVKITDRRRVFMEVNGYDSTKYRYFRNRKTGEIKKYSIQELKDFFWNNNLSRGLRGYIEEYSIKEYPTDMPFDLMEYICMQDDIVFKHDGYIDLHFREKDFLLVTSWLRNKLESNEMPQHPLSILINGPQSVRQYNLDKIKSTSEEERLLLDGYGLKELSKTVLALFSSNDHTYLACDNVQYAFHFNRPISFRVAFKKGEVWSLRNVAVAFMLLNQRFLNTIWECDEVLGDEKEILFFDEYADNVPNTTIRYYKIKDEISIRELHELIGDYLISEDKYNGFRSGIARCFGDLNICMYNPNNFNSDGSFKYFYVKYFDDSSDITMESELLKIADRVPQDIAIERYNEDKAVYRMRKEEREAREYVKAHFARYKKGANRNMTPVQFMRSEQKREKKYLVRRLIKTLNTIIDSVE